jgi:hypothetical protein
MMDNRMEWSDDDDFEKGAERKTPETVLSIRRKTTSVTVDT